MFSVRYKATFHVDLLVTKVDRFLKKHNVGDHLKSNHIPGAPQPDPLLHSRNITTDGLQGRAERRSLRQRRKDDRWAFQDVDRVLAASRSHGNDGSQRSHGECEKVKRLSGLGRWKWTALSAGECEIRTTGPTLTSISAATTFVSKEAE